MKDIEIKKSEEYKIIMISPHSIEDLCRDEAIEIGATNVVLKPGKVEVTGGIDIAYKLCLFSRFASRILVEVDSFIAGNKEDFYKNAVAIEWEKQIPEDATIAIDCRIHSVRNTSLTHSVFAAQLLKDCICDRMRDVNGKRPSVDVKKPNVRISLTIRQTSCSVAIDFSGEPLHKRGYRRMMTQAPVKENIAAAILARAGWRESAKKGYLFVDPMCGSGTFAIEAAYMAAGVAPGLNRSFYGFLKWQKHRPALWQSIVDKARLEASERFFNLIPITASDISAQAINASRENILSAGLEGKINLIQRDVIDLTPQLCFSNEEIDKSEGGFMVMNPPYGERLSDLKQAEQLYRQVGISIPKNFPGWKLAIFAGSKDLSYATGLKPYKTNPLKNGPISTILACYDLAQQQVNEDNKRKEQEGKEIFANKLTKNSRLLKKWIDENGINSYRIYDADMPEFAVAIDVYNTREDGIHVVVAEYAPPPSVARQNRNRRLNIVLSVVPEFFDIPESNVHLKVRKKQVGTDKYLKNRNEFNYFTTEEYGLNFNIDFERYLDTGLFLDHRPVRNMIRNILQEKASKFPDEPLLFMNLFAYTCTASVYAAAAGADTVSVDISSTYLDWGKRNFRDNRFSLKPHRFFREDSLDFLKRERREFSLIYIDPPTFSNSKKRNKPFSVDKDYEKLIKDASQHLTPNGEILFSNNFRKFKMDYSLFPNLEVKEISEATLDDDFIKNRKIHNAYRIKKIN